MSIRYIVEFRVRATNSEGLRRNAKIPLIKAMRATYDLGLKHAKELVDRQFADEGKDITCTLILRDDQLGRLYAFVTERNELEYDGRRSETQTIKDVVI